MLSLYAEKVRTEDKNRIEKGKTEQTERKIEGQKGNIEVYVENGKKEKTEREIREIGLHVGKGEEEQTYIKTEGQKGNI